MTTPVCRPAGYLVPAEGRPLAVNLSRADRIRPQGSAIKSQVKLTHADPPGVSETRVGPGQSGKGAAAAVSADVWMCGSVGNAQSVRSLRFIFGAPKAER
ncbi:Hypothetical protein NTJ_03951 [Nesidiocoris tenuis]|uniref:Uncharacterized protein n=1 Tax=Nesidiocoris tenuis TaxID=355587 RepID=A0ABN7AIN8_9HEMI|nr:Hypothetical protein NTJ_03951 [Nesidiocoris tenuis]